MHNGDITDFSKVRRGLQHQLRDDLFDHMSGTTDPELLFLLILNRLPDCHTQQDPATLQQAVLDALCAVIQANRGKSQLAEHRVHGRRDHDRDAVPQQRRRGAAEPVLPRRAEAPGESAWDLNNADLGVVRRHGDGSERARPPRRAHARARRDDENRNVPESQRDEGEKFVATQALLVSSEPLTGGKGWTAGSCCRPTR